MKAIISGAGIAGLAAALSLSKAGWTVRIIEHAPKLRNGGYMLDFFGPGYVAAEEMGLIEALKARSHDVDAVAFLNGAGQQKAKLSYDMARRAAGGKLFPILRGDIEQVLFDALSDRVQIMFGSEIVAVDNRSDGVTVTLTDGTTDRADLLVGADGIHSGVRRLVFGREEKFIRYLGYHTAAYFFEDDQVAKALAGRFVLLGVPNRLAGLYEVAQGRLASFLVMREQSADRPGDVRSALRRQFGDLKWVVPQALDAAPDSAEIYYDVVAQVEMPRWHQGRTVLIGDAAYAVSLLAGQGASLALAGGHGLGQALADRRDVPAALAEMEQRLRPVVLEKQKSGRQMASWFVPPTPWHIAARNIALAVMNLPGLNRLLGRLFSVSAKGFSPSH